MTTEFDNYYLRTLDVPDAVDKEISDYSAIQLRDLKRHCKAMINDCECDLIGLCACEEEEMRSLKREIEHWEMILWRVEKSYSDEREKLDRWKQSCGVTI